MGQFRVLSPLACFRPKSIRFLFYRDVRYLAVALLSAFFISLTACGGGGSSGSTEESDESGNNSPTAIIYPGSGASISDQVPIRINFDKSMDTLSLTLGGIMAGEINSSIWSNTTQANDTLTISGPWIPSLAPKTLTVDVLDITGIPINTLNLSYVLIDVMVGDIVISELMINSLSAIDADGEWVELFNSTAAYIDLQDFIIIDDDTDIHTITDSIIIDPIGFIVICRNSNQVINGGVDCSYEYTNFLLGNSSDEVVLNFKLLEVDRVNYTGLFAVEGRASNLDPDFIDSTSNDTLTNWCSATSLLANGDFGTPGTLNTQCP
jgi:hypothetical protein